MRVVAISLAVSVLAGCGHSPTRPVERAARRLAFDDNASQPLGYVDRGVVVRRGTIAVHDVAYLSGGERVDGYLVEGPQGRRRPGIILVHGSGGDRRELVGAAVALAGRGAVAMTITEPSSAHPTAAATGRHGPARPGAGDDGTGRDCRAACRRRARVAGGR